MRRFAFAVIAVIVAGVAGWDARPLRGAAPAGAGEGVTVGSQRVAPAAIEAAAARIAGHRSRRLPAARRAESRDRALC